MFDLKGLHTVVTLLMFGNCVVGICIGLGVGYWVWG